MYIHGKGGSAAECEHYRPLFPDCEVIGLDYQSDTPWEAGEEIREAVKNLKKAYQDITLTLRTLPTKLVHGHGSVNHLIASSLC